MRVLLPTERSSCTRRRTPRHIEIVLGLFQIGALPLFLRTVGGIAPRDAGDHKLEAFIDEHLAAPVFVTTARPFFRTARGTLLGRHNRRRLLRRRHPCASPRLAPAASRRNPVSDPFVRFDPPGFGHQARFGLPDQEAVHRGVTSRPDVADMLVEINDKQCPRWFLKLFRQIVARPNRYGCATSCRLSATFLP